MKNTVQNLLIALFVLVGYVTGYSQTVEQRRSITKNYDKVALSKMKVEYAAKFKANYERALVLAKQNGWALKIKKADGGVSELQGVTDDGKPLYYTTSNLGSSITSRVNKIQPGGGLGLNLTGAGMTAGIWEQSRPLMNHLDLAGRITEGDSEGETGDHATHVTGTIISSGAHNPDGRGMAYEGNAIVYEWTNDLDEMLDFANSGYLLSNHSYGLVASFVPIYYFGAYLSDSKDLDNLLFAAPGYQTVVAAGNDRGKGLNPDDKGYDLLTKYTTSKNAIVVAAVNEVLDYTDASSVEMSTFSSWGPTDDNRIKPDISTKGVDVISTWYEFNNPNILTSYAAIDGTSMACPGITGTLLLLQQHYSNVYSGNFMLSATLRALMIHTASEAGDFPGPDPKFGWGLMDAAKSAQVITDSKETKAIISELNLKKGVPYIIQVKATGNEPLVATIDWTDRGGPVNTGTIDKDAPVLVNNLDMRITKDTEVYFPWKLGPTFKAPAEKGPNDVDNVEKIEIDSPVAGEVYTITVTNKGALVGLNQDFSLIVTGANENLSVNETAFKAFNVWPNPIKDKLNISIQSELSDDVYVTVYDMLGKRLIDKKLDFANDLFNGKLDVDFLNPGNYVVKVIQGDKQSVRKIIKE